MWRYSISKTKFSYIFAVRITPVGCPEQTIIPSFTVKVSGAVFTFTAVNSGSTMTKSRSCSIICGV